MLRTKPQPAGKEESRAFAASGPRRTRSDVGDPPTGVQIRTCVRCGRHTTFLLDDLAGGWYVCSGCGRNA